MSFALKCAAPLVLSFAILVPARANEPKLTIETVAGNGQPGDLTAASGNAAKLPLDQPFGVECGPDGALYITSVGQHRVLRLDLKTRELTSVAGSGRQGYSGDGG